MILLQTSDGSNQLLLHFWNHSKGWKSNQLMEVCLKGKCSICPQWKHLFIKVWRQKCLTMQTLISEPTPLLFQQKYRFNRPPECRKDKSNSNTMKLFSLLRHKAESLAGNGGGGGPAGEDLNTAEEINCRLLVAVHCRSSGELQKEFGVGLGSVAGEGFTHSKPLSL